MAALLSGEVDPLALIQKYYRADGELYAILVTHSRLVAEKALAVARRVAHLGPDLKFIREAALLHDIGIFLTYFPEIGCYGSYPYICHGYLGRELLEKEGLPRHALVCERHVGVGITREEIEKRGLPLPPRDMVPVTLEEEIVCFADKFFSKDPKQLTVEKSPVAIKQGLSDFGPEKVAQFEAWLERFKESLTGQ